jgi:hypothetical protein
LLVDDEFNTPTGLVLELGQLMFEAQEAHAAALPTVESELRGAAGRAAVGGAERVAGGGAGI